MFDADPTERSPAKPRAQAGELRLTVLGGHHAGSTLALGAEGTVLIGSSEAADIILMDAGIAHEHLILTCGPEQIGLTAGDGGVAIGTGRDARKMSTGESTALTLPARFTLVGAGGWMIEIAVEAMEAAAATDSGAGQGFAWAQMGAVGFVERGVGLCSLGAERSVIVLGCAGQSGAQPGRASGCGQRAE